MLMLFSGLIKYGERVWVIRSRVRADHLVQSYESSAIGSSAWHDAKLALKAYSNFQILKPHNANYLPGKNNVENLIRDFHAWVRGEESFNIQSTFKLIEIELGFAYDMLFSKVNTIFTAWGFLFRLISVSCLVTVLVKFQLIIDSHQNLSTVDILVTYFLLFGAIFIEICGVLVQLSSNWAIVWAFKHQGKLVTPVFQLHKLVNSKSKRWCELMGQVKLLDTCIKKDNLSMFQKMVKCLYCRETMLSSPVQPRLKELIINQLCDTFPDFSDAEDLPTLRMERGAWSFDKKWKCMEEEFKWSIDDQLEFSKSITIWHVATDICYRSELGKSVKIDDEMKELSIVLSDYMMHLLVKCRYETPICKPSDNCIQGALDDLKIFFEGKKSIANGEKWNQLLEEQGHGPNNISNSINKLAHCLMGKVDRWKIMSNVWVEMLCYAAGNCPVNNHVRQLNNGGELLTHVWLLLLHFGVSKKRAGGIWTSSSTS